MSGSTATVISPRSTMRPLRLRRKPRPDEIALLHSLASGPLQITEGPVGRCSKRGWCRAVSIGRDKRGGRIIILYELTPSGVWLLSAK